MPFADSLLNKKHKDDKYYEDVNELYGALKNQLQLYYQVAQQGGWPTITAGKKPLKKGQSGPEFIVIKKRLQLTHDMAEGDSSDVFTDTLENGVKNFQQRHGYTPNGIITPSLLNR